MTGAAKNTITKLLLELGTAFLAYSFNPVSIRTGMSCHDLSAFMVLGWHLRGWAVGDFYGFRDPAALVGLAESVLRRDSSLVF